jgi:gliding motility-associated protein GldE
LEDPPGYTLFAFLPSAGPLAYGVSLGVTILLWIAAGVIAACEAAFFSLSPESIERFRLSARKSENRVARLLQKPRLLLATLRVGTSLAMLGQFLLSTLIALGDSTGLIPVIIIWTIALSMLVVLLTDVFPKTLAVAHNLQVARFFSGFCNAMVILLKPFATPWLKMSSLVERSGEKNGYHDKAEALNNVLEMAAAAQETSDEDKEILRGVVNFGTLTVKQVMRSKSKMSAAEASQNLEQLMAAVSASGYSRMPVYRKNLDHIEGILHIKDLLPYMQHGKDFKWQNLLRPALYVPATKKLDSLLKDFQEKHIHIAIVVNEFGGTLGLITLEDIIEEIIGDINDEFDEDTLNYQKIDDHNYIFEGKTTLHDFCKLMGIDEDVFEPVRGQSKSLGGLILELSHELPKNGARINFEQFTFTIESADRRRIKRIKITIHEKEEV